MIRAEQVKIDTELADIYRQKMGLAQRILAVGNFSRMDFVPGYILYVKDRALLAQPFDAGGLKFNGEPFPVVDDVAVGGGGAANAEFSASHSGVLVFRGGAGIAQSRFTWVDRAGHDLRASSRPQVGLICHARFVL